MAPVTRTDEEDGLNPVDRLSTDLGSAALTDYGTRLRRRWWVVALGLLVGLAVGVALLAAQSKQYTSTTAVLVTPVGPGSSSSTSSTTARTGSDVNLDTESQIVGSAQVADAVRTLLRTADPVTDLQKNVSVTVPPNSSVLSIAYTAGSAKAAQQGSHAFAQAYLANRADTAKKQVALTVAGLQTQLDAAQAQLKTLTDKSATLVDNSPDKVYADAQRNVVISQINDLTSRLAPLTTAAATPGQIITDAPLPKRASAPIPALDLGGGLVVGLLLGLAAAIGLDRRDHRLRRSADVTRLVGLPVLAEVPADRSGGGFPGDGQGPLFDRLRNSLVGSGRSASSVQVADAANHGATGTVALQLARSLVRSAGQAVLVVAHPDSTLPRLTGTTDRPGLAEVLRGELSLEDALVVAPDLPGVRVLAPGRRAGDLDALLQSPRLGAVLAGLRDVGAVVVETRSTGDSAAAQAVSAHVGTVLLVAERGRTDSTAVTEASTAAEHMGAQVCGVVLVAPFRRESGSPAAAPAAGRDRPGPALSEPALSGTASTAPRGPVANEPTP